MLTAFHSSPTMWVRSLRIWWRVPSKNYNHHLGSEQSQQLLQPINFPLDNILKKLKKRNCTRKSGIRNNFSVPYFWVSILRTHWFLDVFKNLFPSFRVWMLCVTVFENNHKLSDKKYLANFSNLMKFWHENSQRT